MNQLKARALASLVSAIALTSCSSTDSATAAALVIAQAKAAMGGKAWDDIKIWYEEGQAIKSSGAVSTYQHWGDLHTLGLYNISSTRQGDMRFDGKAAYLCADAACTSRTDLDARSVRGGAYAVSYGYFFPDRFPASLKYLGVHDGDDGVQYDV